MLEIDVEVVRGDIGDAVDLVAAGRFRLRRMGSGRRRSSCTIFSSVPR
jgi:hypothetical protein